QGYLRPRARSARQKAGVMRSRLMIPIGIIGMVWTAFWLHAWVRGSGQAGENIAWTGIAVVLLLVLARALAVGKGDREARERTERLNQEVRRAYADRDAALEASRTGVALFSHGKARFWNHAFVEVLGLAGDGQDMTWNAFNRRLGRPMAVGEETTLERGERHVRIRVSELADGDVLVTVDDVT